MKARIYRPTRTAMQSGTANTHKWRLEFKPTAGLYIDPLMGWSGMTDTTQEIKMDFDTEEAAMDYAKRCGLDIEVREPKIRVIKPKSYATNFAYNKMV